MDSGLVGATKSTKQCRHEVVWCKTKEWVRTTLLHGKKSYLPAFEDLFYQLQWISRIEDAKYPGIQHQGFLMVQQFAWDACEPGANFEDLRNQYQLPGAPE